MYVALEVLNTFSWARSQKYLRSTDILHSRLLLVVYYILVVHFLLPRLLSFLL